MKKKALLIQQLEQKMQSLKSLPSTSLPAKGWIRAIRQALGMSSQQLGYKLKMTRQGVKKWKIVNIPVVLHFDL